MTQKLHCILLIDDDEPTNFISSMLVEEAECTEHIQIAEGGQQALDYLTRSVRDDCDGSTSLCPDIIFLDINMPGMNGWEFLDRYRKLEKKHHGKIIIIMLTTSLNPDDVIKAQEMPEVSGFENKPLTADKLDGILRKYFSPNY